MAFNRQPYSFEKYGVGKKVYGSGRSYPHRGPVADKLGYKQRDARVRTKRNALLRRMQANQKKKHASADWLRSRGR